MRLPKMLVVGCTITLAAGGVAPAWAKEARRAPIGSIRPAGFVKAADLPALARISFEDAMKTALAAAPGRIIRAELEIEEGNLMYSFEIVGVDKSITEVEIGAGNGQVLATERDESKQEAKPKKR